MNNGFSVVNHVGITVSNLEKSIEFYETLTGKKISNKDEIGGKRMAQTQGLDDTLIRYANLHLDNINIDILEYVEPKSTKANYSNEQISAMHLCFEVDDIETAVARMKEIGIEPEGEPIYLEKSDGLKVGFGTGVVYFKDPDGTNLELIAPKGPFQRERN
ncbi:VOC family protein [Ligilactobacillus salivarius]